MRRLGRYILNLLTVLSLLLCLLAVALWVRSYRAPSRSSCDAFSFEHGWSHDRVHEYSGWEMVSLGEGLVFFHDRTSTNSTDLNWWGDYGYFVDGYRTRWDRGLQRQYLDNLVVTRRFCPVIILEGSSWEYEYYGNSGYVAGHGAPHRDFAAALSLLPLVRLLVLLRRSWKGPPGCCQKCGYDLRATPDRCPECGTVAE